MTELETAVPVVGAGQLRDDDDEQHEEEDGGEGLHVVELPPPLPATLPEGPRIEVEWEARRLKKPLQLVVGKTVNWRIRSRLGVDTDAGLMSDEQALDIADPAAEILNRHDATRALAAKGVELELIAAIYEYVQETSVRAGQAAYASRLRQEQAGRGRVAPPQPFPTDAAAATDIPRAIRDDEGDDQL